MFTGLTYDVGIPWVQTLPAPDGEWELIEIIGEGTYGEVYKGRNCKTGETAAVKIMDAILDKEEDIKSELNIFEKYWKHPNVVMFYGAFLKRDQIADDRIWLVMELCANGSVTDLVRAMHDEGASLSEDIIGYLLKEVLSGLSFLHSQHYMHRDVKGQNCLLTAHGRVKLVDFGISAELKCTHDMRHTSIGTPYWMSPEVIACEHQLDMEYDLRADIWSLGITAIEIADGVPPLYGEHLMKAIIKIPKNPPPTLKHPEKWSRQINDFVSRCLVKDFEKRPFSRDLLNHKFIRMVPANTKPLQRKILGLIDMYKTAIMTDSDTVEDFEREGRRTPIRVKSLKPIDNLANLEVVDENIIVLLLEKRFRSNLIYTYVGDILISVNPLKELGLYNNEIARRYCGAQKGQHSPHIFAVADGAYQGLLTEKRDQCCIISGESGAGKTEASNILVHHFMRLGKAESRALEERILQVNPLLEAFGNARTVINSNSSRFGKYLELHFTDSGLITGAHLSEYLLERSRVVGQARNEKNFHIFYYFLAGVQGRTEMIKYACTSVNQHRYLRVGGTGKSGKKNLLMNEKLREIEQCLTTIGFKRHEIENIYKILSAVLHLGDIKIEADTHEAHISEAACISRNDEVLKFVASLLTLNPREVRKALTTATVIAHGETIVKPMTIDQAMDARDATAKALYGRLFSWIVNRVNQILQPTFYSESSRVVGILDIFGFENFKSNSFEQLCINIVNEQLQFYFNQYIFAWEQEEYQSEGVNAQQVTYTDNRPILELFLNRPMGLLDLLDEQSRFPGATDLSLAEKLHDNLSSPLYIPPKDRGPSFTIIHYAGPVTYEVTRFLEKNRDTLHSDVLHLLRDCGNALVRQLFYAPLSRTGGIAEKPTPRETAPSATPLFRRKGPEISKERLGPSNTPLSSIGTHTIKRSQTISAYFVFSLRDLMSKMLKGTPHFVRCIKPNDVKSSEMFNKEKVLQQLRYTGVMEAIRIRKEGYSHRITFKDFIIRYQVISYPLSSPVESTPRNCIQIAMQAGLENWAIGRTKVFLKYYHVERLAQILSSYNKAAIQMEKVVRGFLARRRCRKLRMEQRAAAATQLQRVVRGWLQRKRYARIMAKRKAAAITLQAAVRGWLTRRRYLAIVGQREMAAIIIQKVFRGWRARKYCYEKRKKMRKEMRKHRLRAVICLQSYVRGWIARRRVSKLKKNLELERRVKAAIAIQKVVRGFLVRKKVVELRMKFAKRKRYDAAVILQKAVRVWLAKKTLSNLKDRDIERKERAAIVLQQAVRRWLAARSQKKTHLEMQRKLAAVTKIQAAYRGWLARKRVKNMKQKRAIVRKKQRTMKEDSILQRLQRQALVTAALEEKMVSERKASFKPNGRMPSHSQSSPDQHHQPELGYQLHKEHHQNPLEYTHASHLSMKGQPRTSSQHHQPTSSHHPSSARSIDQSINVEDGKQREEQPSKRVRRPDVAVNDSEVAGSDPSHQISHNLMSLALKTSVKAKGHGQDSKQFGLDRSSSLNTYKMYSDRLKQFMSKLESQCEYVSLLQQSTAAVSVLPKVAKGRSKSSSSDDRYNSKSGQLVPNPRSPYSPLQQRRVATPSSLHLKGTTPTSKEHQSQKIHQNRQLTLSGQQGTHPHLKTTPPSPHLQRAMHNSQIHIQKTTLNPHPKRTPTSSHPKRTTPPLPRKETTPSPHLKESTSSSEQQTTPIRHQHQTTPPSPRLPHGELRVVMEHSPHYLTSLVSFEGKAPSRTKSTKLYFERIAEENKKQAEANVPKRGMSFISKWKRGGDSKFHPQKRIPEISTSGGISNLQQFFSKFKSKHFVQDSFI